MKIKPLFKHDLIRLLRSFTGKEQKRFLTFLKSEFFSTRKALAVLYSELIKFHPLYKDSNCTKELLYDAVYPGWQYNGGTMRDLLSELFDAAVEFTAVEAFRSSNESVQFKIDELRQRGLFKNSHKLLKEKLSQNNFPLKIDSDFFIENYRLQVKHINLRMIYSNYRGTGSADQLASDFSKAEEYLLMYTFLENTSNLSNFLIFEESLQKEGSEKISLIKAKELYNTALYKLFTSESNFNFAIEVYKALLDAFYKCGKFEWYKKYKALITKHSKKFSKDDLSMHFSKLINCCILGAKYGRSPDEFNYELVNIYYTFLENGYFRNKKTKFIPPNLFRAIVLHAVKMKKIPWLLRVINRFADDLLPAERENMKQYAMAFYYYSTGNYGKALETISTINITQFIFKYDIYNLKLRIYFEERSYTSALELIHTYSQFLRNDKMMPAPRKAFHRAFLKYTKRLISITEGSKKFEAGLEIQKLQKENCAYKDWLTEKLSLFESSKKKYSMAG